MSGIKSKKVEERDRMIYAEFLRVKKKKDKKRERMFWQIANKFGVDSIQTVRRAIAKFE